MKLADTVAAARLVDRPPGTIRRWASTGLLTRHGSDHRGRTLYDLEQVEAVACQHPSPTSSTRQADAPS